VEAGAELTVDLQNLKDTGGASRRAS